MIRIFTTGGTIDKIYFDRKNAFQVGEPQIVELLQEANIGLEYETTSILRKDSLDLTDADRRLIVDTVRTDPADRILVTHGTDTMIETARLLAAAVADKTVILVGAMQPARIRSSDAEFNIGFAVAAVQLLPHGVYIAMNGQVFTPDKVRKNLELNRFEQT